MSQGTDQMISCYGCGAESDGDPETFRREHAALHPETFRQYGGCMFTTPFFEYDVRALRAEVPAPIALTDFLSARISERRLFWEMVAEAKQAHPDRVRREMKRCDADDRIVELHTSWAGDANDYGQTRQVLEILASVHSDHEDYRDEWKP